MTMRTMRMRRARAKLPALALLACLTLYIPKSRSFSLTYRSSKPPLAATTSLWATRNNEAAEVAAGRDGYSILRQPASQSGWDPNVDPDFDVPASLQDDSQQDNEWWDTRRQSKETDSVLSTKKKKQQQQSISSVTTVITKPEELDLFQRSLDTLDYPRVLQSLYEECTTSPARKLVLEAGRHENTSNKKKKKIPKGYERAYQPLTAESVEGTQERYQAVQEMEWLLERVDELQDYSYKNRRGFKESLAGRPPPLQSTFDLQDILVAADQGRVLDGDEIQEISAMLNAMENVVRWSAGLDKVEEMDFVELPKLANCISVNETLQELLQNAFDQDGRLSGTTFPAIGRLRARVRSLKGDIMDKLDGLLAMPSIKSKLALEGGGPLYSEVSGGRLVLPIDVKEASSVGIVHDTSRSGKTVFVEPTEIVGPTNELRQAEGELRTEEARVWRLLTEQVLKNRVSLETSVNAIGQLDLVLARLMLGRKISGVIPDVRDEGVISLRDAKHPVLLLREIDNVVGSDIDMGANGNQGLVLTGPNAGGKTVILKLLGLVALMSRGGIPVPAERKEDEATNGEEYRPRVDFFNPVVADIGDIQSVGGDLSTFSGHMLVCREVLANSGRNALVLMDEPGSGTDPAQGVAIAQALLEELMETGSRVAITTHYMQLKQLAASDNRLAVGGMQFLNGRPTYKLLPGTVGESFALSVAERLELPQRVIDRASELLDSETRQMGDLIRDLEDQKAVVDQQALELEEKRKEMAKMEFQMKEQQIKLEKKQLGARRDEAKKFAKKLEEKEQILEGVLEKLKSDPSRRIVAKSWEDIKFVKRDALNEAENIPSVIARKKQAAAAMDEEAAELVPIGEMRNRPELKEGDALVVCKKGPLFGREGSITKLMGANRVEVRVNNMNVGFKLGEVALPTKKSSNVKSSGAGSGRKPNSISKAAEKALAAEKFGASDSRRPTDTKEKSGVSIRTQSNTIDVRGCNLDEAKEKAKEKFSACLMTGRPVVYILHGHGTGGVLKTKIRNWLKSERQLVKRYQPADVSDGGDAFTRVELR